MVVRFVTWQRRECACVYSRNKKAESERGLCADPPGNEDRVLLVALLTKLAATQFKAVCDMRLNTYARSFVSATFATFARQIASTVV